MTRRQFLRSAIAGGVLGAGLTTTCRGAAHAGAARRSADVRRDSADIETELQRRAAWQLEQTRLVVDYYRIGRKIAYPLPLPELVVPDVAVPSIATYPWATWLLWTLEERITALGWAAEWFGDRRAAKAASADLAALAQWGKYQQYSGPDLSSAHAGRILWRALNHWSWVDDRLRGRLRAACRRHVQALLPASDKLYSSIRNKQDVLERDAPHRLLHNIPLIGTIGAALTAAASGHDAVPALHARVTSLFGAVLDLRTQGYCEGVGYDGYVLDFVADWLATLAAAGRAKTLDHPNLNHYLEQSYMLGAPGAAEQVAELSDVEPHQMPFHLCAQAKLQQLQPQDVRSWLLGRCPLRVLRSDGLAALHETRNTGTARAPSAGALDAHYAAVLRSGWEREDVAVAVACSRSPANHIQQDSGTLVIGTRGNWLIADPGYQQYVKGRQREFTIGPAAHNAPVIDGHAPSRKAPRRLTLGEASPGVQRVAIDLTACYQSAASVSRLLRQVWLGGKEVVVVADELEVGQPVETTCYWHAHADAAWWFESGWALVTLGQSKLWLTCHPRGVSATDLQRLPGSPGPLSLVCPFSKAAPVTWWAFAFTAHRPTMSVERNGRALRLQGYTLLL